MPSYPSTLPYPTQVGYNLAPKESKRSMVTDSEELRLRKKARGDRYVGTVSFHLKNKVLRQAWLDWFETIGQGDLWFSADWLDGAGFNAGEWLFKFINRTQKETGFRQDFKLAFLMRPVSYTDEDGHIDTHELVESDWPDSGGGEPPLCEDPVGGDIVNDGDNVQHDGDEVTVDPTWATIAPTVVAFDWSTSDTTKDPDKALPETGNPKWVHPDTFVYEVGDDFFAGDPYGAAPSTTVFGETESAMDGELCNQRYTNNSAAYVEYEITDPLLKDQINAGRIEFGFACQHLFRDVSNTNPIARCRIEFLDCVGRILYNAQSTVQRASEGVEEWNEFRIESATPKETTFIRVWFEFKRVDEALNDYFSVVDNCILVYRSCD